MAGASVLCCEHLDIVQQLAGGFVQTDRMQRFTLILGTGHPDLVSRNHRRRISLPWNRGFPRDVFVLIPVNGDPLLRGMTLPVGPSKLRPVRCQTHGDQQKNHAG